MKLLEPITIHKEVISHSYPYDWRTQKPVVIRLSNQWFVDTEKISHFALVSIVNGLLKTVIRHYFSLILCGITG